ncbi:hypothetical protein [Niabella ginsengisoli]|uniref:Uncharacterized protein n=1 Tax=Niabella ginsengisoli TaxID=522298 RepID=A0ABS9SEV9_9BACT|nr:hypothetical protein [Niabella ginsengisoli]MCH5596856.1 hypothetical protein [Niabella ginsengisoli]
MSHSTVTLVCVSANVLMIGGVYFARSLGNTVLLIIAFALSFSIIGILYATLPKRRLVIQRQIITNLQNRKANSKVIDLNTKQHIPAEKIQG